jgi:hypothetical protein
MGTKPKLQEIADSCLLGGYFALALADNPTDIMQLETDLETNQAAAVDRIIEDTCWGAERPALRPLLGNKGTPEARRAAFVAEYRKEWPKMFE